MSIIYVFCWYARQSFFVFLTFLVSCISAVFMQPLQLPPESFPCGSASDICERWGYDTCIFRDGEHYCFPCSHDYFSTLCGSKEENQGCNLFCAGKALEKERTKLQSEFSSQRTNMQTNFTKEKKYLQSFFETKLKVKETEVETFRKEKTVQGNKTKSLEGEVRKKTDLIIGLSTALGVLALMYVALVVCLWCRMYCCNRKTSSDCEAPEQNFQLLPKEEDTRRKVGFAEQQNRSVLPFQDKSVKSDGVTDELEQKPDESTQEVRKCNEGVCPGKAMLQNIPPSDKDESFVMAIN